MRYPFEDRCEDGHTLAPSDELFRWECTVCGMGLWEAGEATQDFDAEAIEAYAHALGAS